MIEEAGVWEKILEPSEKLLERLLPSLSPKTQEDILKFETKKSVIVLKPTKKKGGIEEEEEDE